MNQHTPDFARSFPSASLPVEPRYFRAHAPGFSISPPLRLHRSQTPIVSISTIDSPLLFSFPISKLPLSTSPLARRALLTVSAWVDLDARLLIDYLRQTYGIGFAT